MVNCREGFHWLISTLVAAAFEYDTPKYVHIKNKKVGVLNRLVQLAILGYVIGYGIVWQNGAQETEAVQSVVTTKVKGVNMLSSSAEEFMVNCPTNNWSIFDHVDLVVPPQEPNSFFVTTNMWVTCNQKYGICPEDDSIPNAKCDVADNDCPNGTILRNGNGVTNGTCSPNGTCYIYAWCPVEHENDTLTGDSPKLDIQNFTVLVKNSISFPNLDKDYRVRNIPNTTNRTFLKDCSFDSNSEDGLFCPIFKIQQIIDMIDPPVSYDELATEGAVVGLNIDWNCNLDISSSYCKPKYSARRLDNPAAQISKGYNFRYAKYYRVDGEEVRDVWKVYGIKFEVQVTGQGRKFSFTRLVLALGSTIALLAIATTVTDIVTLYLLKKGTYYRQKKYQRVEKTDGYVTVTNAQHSETLPILRGSPSSSLGSNKEI